MSKDKKCLNIKTESDMHNHNGMAVCTDYRQKHES